ncbi:MAG TPA: peptidyl-prolyl cis-trans isomerase [Candidatus Binatia bacterium]|nr:peptidyl-prolyl cis-trans isomerase [Candidatus Binatia bacterium]
MIRIRPLFPTLAALGLVLGLWSCAGSSGGKNAPARGPQVWKPSRPDPRNTTLAVIAGRPLTRRDVDSVLATAPPSIREDYLVDPEQYKLLVDRIVQQQIVYLAAIKTGTENDSAYRADLEATQRQVLMKHYYQKTVQSLPAIPDSTVRRYYDAHPSEFAAPGRVRVRHIQVATQARAREVQNKLHTTAWENVCARYSTDKVTAKDGGILGFVTSDGDQVPGIGKAPSIVAAAFKLKEGEVSEPLKAERAWHIIRVDQKTEAGPQPYATVEHQLRGNIETERNEHFQEALLDSLKREFHVVVYPDSIETAMKPVLTPAQLFARAQNAPQAKDRIDLFRQVVRDYPNDKSAIQADFMIGFTFAEELRDYPSARAAFQEFLRKYPKSDLVASANWMLENMEHSAPPPGLEPDSLQFEILHQKPSPGTNSKP